MLRKCHAWILLTLLAQTTMGTEILTDGNAVLSMLGPPVWDTYLGNGALLTDTGANDQLYQYCWYYRTPNYNQNRYFSYLDQPTESWSGNTATITYTNAGPGLAGQPWSERLDASFRLKIIDGPSPNQIRVLCALTLHNPNPGTVTYQIFNLADLDLGGTLADDSVQVLFPGEARARYTEAASADYAEVLAAGATRFEANQGFPLRNKLNNITPFDLDNSPAFSGDAAVAFQWTVTLAHDASKTIRSGFSINQPAIVDQPCTPQDANCDNELTLDDLPAFVDLLLTNSTPCGLCAGDLNRDGKVDGRDIQQFIAEMLGL